MFSLPVKYTSKKFRTYYKQKKEFFNGKNLNPVIFFQKMIILIKKENK